MISFRLGKTSDKSRQNLGMYPIGQSFSLLTLPTSARRFLQNPAAPRDQRLLDFYGAVSKVPGIQLDIVMDTDWSGLPGMLSLHKVPAEFAPSISSLCLSATQQS